MQHEGFGINILREQILNKSSMTGVTHRLSKLRKQSIKTLRLEQKRKGNDAVMNGSYRLQLLYLELTL